MKIINPIHMNDWPIKKLLLVVLSFQLLVVGSIGLDYLGIKFPILRQLVCFIYVSFIPGVLFMRVLKLHRLGTIETLLYATGLSISILMFTGLFTNVFYPIIGFQKPISIVPLLFSVSLIVLILCILCFIMDKNFSNIEYISFREFFSAPSLFLYLIPILTVIGTHLMNFYQNNLLLMILLFLISLIIILVCFESLPSSLYPLAIISISLSLLFHNSLISMHIFGWDIQSEYYFANKVLGNSLWNFSIYSNINAMLSIVMLAPIYSILLNLDLTWVFKIIYPVIFSLLPLGLYVIFQKQTTAKIAFISVFFFMSFYVFYTEMLQLARQQIAEYFFVLMILLTLQNKFDVSSRFLLIIFSFSVIVSHYGLSYLIMGALFLSLLISLFNFKHTDCFFRKNVINYSFIFLSFTFLFSWYIYISNSSTFSSFIHIFGSIVNNFFSDFLNLDKTQGLFIITQKSMTPFHGIYKLMHIFTQICISVGLLYSLLKVFMRKDFKFDHEYLSLSVVFYFLLLAAIIVPNFVNYLNTSRLYQITLITLAPFCVIGGVFILNSLFIAPAIFKKLFEHKSTCLSSESNKNYNNIKIIFFEKVHNFSISLLKFEVNQEKSLPFKVLSVFLAIFLLFNTGWIYEVMNDSPTSFSLNSTVDYPKFSEQEIAGKDWLYQVLNSKEYENTSPKIYADYFRVLLFRNCLERSISSMLPTDSFKVPVGSYIFFSTHNILKHEVLLPYNIGVNNIFKYYPSEGFILVKNKIYDNGGSIVYNG